MPLYKPTPNSPEYGTRLDNCIWTAAAPGCRIATWSYPSGSPTDRFTAYNNSVQVLDNLYNLLPQDRKDEWQANAELYPEQLCAAEDCTATPAPPTVPLGQKLHRLYNQFRTLSGQEYTDRPFINTVPIHNDTIDVTAIPPPPAPPLPLLTHLWAKWNHVYPPPAQPFNLYIFTSPAGPSAAPVTIARTLRYSALVEITWNTDTEISWQSTFGHYLLPLRPFTLRLYLAQPPIAPTLKQTYSFWNQP